MFPQNFIFLNFRPHYSHSGAIFISCVQVQVLRENPQTLLFTSAERSEARVTCLHMHFISPHYKILYETLIVQVKCREVVVVLYMKSDRGRGFKGINCTICITGLTPSRHSEACLGK